MRKVDFFTNWNQSEKEEYSFLINVSHFPGQVLIRQNHYYFWYKTLIGERPKKKKKPLKVFPDGLAVALHKWLIALCSVDIQSISINFNKKVLTIELFKGCFLSYSSFQIALKLKWFSTYPTHIPVYWEMELYYSSISKGREGLASGFRLGSLTSAGLRLGSTAEPGLKLVAWVGNEEPEAIASCFASTLCSLSFSSRPCLRSSSSLPQPRHQPLSQHHKDI